MADKPGPGREKERFPAQPTQKEYQKPKEKIDTDTNEKMLELQKSVDIKEQMPQSNQEAINKMLQECANGTYMKKEQLDGYEAFASGKFSDPIDVHPGHIAYLYANNLLTEGREVVVGEYEDGYAMYHKKG